MRISPYRLSITLVTTAIITLAIASCDMNPYPEKIIGEWTTTEWLVGQDKTPKSNYTMDFDFNKDGTYSIDYGAFTETGIYRVEGYNLYTTETGQIEKNVKITKLDGDDMEIEMNRAGRVELLKIKRK